MLTAEDRKRLAEAALLEIVTLDARRKLDSPWAGRYVAIANAALQDIYQREIYVEQKPSLGRIVLFRQQLSNDAVEHPAIITRVWSDTCINLTVFPDYGSPDYKTSVVQNESMVEGNQERAWRWPPSV